MKQQITPQEARRLIDTGPVVYLDVRTVPEYEAKRPTGAWNIPVVEPGASGQMSLNPLFLSVVEAHLAKDARIVTGCRSGGRSDMAAAILRQAGYTQVSNMLGGLDGGAGPGSEGIPGWSELDYPTDSGPSAEHGYDPLKTALAQSVRK